MSWWYGSNNDYFSGGPFDSREEAIEEGKSDYGGDPFWIIEAELYPIKFLADELINSQYFEKDDLFDYDNAEPERCGDKQLIAQADKELQFYLDKWIKEWSGTFVQPNLFAWQRNDEYIEPEQEEEGNDNEA